jgi:hypothetical protein
LTEQECEKGLRERLGIMLRDKVGLRPDEWSG